MKKILLVLTALILVSGCTQRIADLTIGSTKNVNINGDNFVEGDRVVGNDTTPIILLPIGVPNVEEATDAAIEQDACAVALTDITIESGFFSFLVGAIWYDVEGTLLIDKTKPGCQDWENRKALSVASE
ncbi:lipoprotein [Enterovibrio baiacu]|uniref:lipoprotein n=1 Tax=Enterovibrio baiacu TaxID=2491023 RepID=UPI003D09C1DB